MDAEVKQAWDKDKVYRSTKCFSPRTISGYPGSFPIGFIQYLQSHGWWGGTRVYLCGGRVAEADSEGVTVDCRPEANPDYLQDASATDLPDGQADFVCIDPPYTKDLAEKLYGTGKQYKGINAFAKEGSRLLCPGGLLVTLSYEVPARPPGCDFIAVVGIYQTMGVAHMRCLTVSRKRE